MECKLEAVPHSPPVEVKRFNDQNSDNCINTVIDGFVMEKCEEDLNELIISNVEQKVNGTLHVGNTEEGLEPESVTTNSHEVNQEQEISPTVEEKPPSEAEKDEIKDEEVLKEIERLKTEENEKTTLFSFITEVEHRAETKLKLRERNHMPQRPDDAALAKLDSSLKKNTALVRKFRNFTAPQLESLLKDMSSLNLSKYTSEVASALVEAKLKLNDVPAAVILCSEMHNTYSEFSKVLLDHWMKTLSLRKDEKIPNPSKLRVDLRFYGDLITSGIFQYKEALPLLGNVLTVLTTSDKEEHNNISIILSFCKHCGEDYAGLLPRSVRLLSEKYGVPVPRSSMLPPEKQRNVRSLLKDYYGSLCKHLLKEHSDMQAFERQNRRILQTKGELSAERKEKGIGFTYKNNVYLTSV